MIPLKLEIRNFLSYRNKTTLDFHGIHLATITGPNGAGKSSILDAITWALFGKSRSKSDDDVVNRRAQYKGEEAEVRYIFELDSVVYRVIRRKQARKPMLLDFQVATSDESWKSLSESGIRQTQAAIESLLKMNFETFINSSFLLQGKADEFTIRTPNKRKEILAELLGVNEWDHYKEVATGHRRDEEDELIVIESRLKDIETELAERPDREEALKRVLERAEFIKSQLSTQERLLSQATQMDAVLKQQGQIVNNLAANLEQQRRQLAETKRSQKRQQQEKEGFQRLFDEATEIEAAYTSWQEAKKIEERWQQKANNYNELLQKMKPFELALERELSRLNERRSELQNQESRISKLVDEQEALLPSIQLNKERLADLEQKLASFVEIQQKFQDEYALLNELETNRRLLVQESLELKQRAAETSKLEAERPTLVENLTEATAAVENVKETLLELDENYQRAVGAQADLDILAAKQKRLKLDMEQLRDRLDRLQVEAGGKCPLCGQELTEDHRQSMLRTLESEGKSLAEDYRSNQESIKQLDQEISDLRSKVAQRDRFERELKAQQHRVATLEAQLAEIDRQLERWQEKGAERYLKIEAQLSDDKKINEQRLIVQNLQTELEQKADVEKDYKSCQREVIGSEARLKEISSVIINWEGGDDSEGLAAELADVKRRLSEEDIDPEAQSALDELRKEVEQINYDAEKHSLAIQNSQTLAGAEQRYQDLKQAEAATKSLDDSLADLATQIENQKNIVSEQESQYEEARLRLQELESEKLDLASIEEETHRLREERIAAERVVATAQQNVDVLDTLEEQRRDNVAKEESSRQRIRRLKMLEKACGRDGVQALLIERALPEIEESANKLLARLSNGEMQVDFDTVRQLKSSDRTVETLDIRIIDNLGERPYENYSGGEQFRVNFAIRLALSQLLTRRAGARLQTLVIDEGFGSQDPGGRQRLIEAIHAIEDDFKKILVITHIDEMRDAFPNRIEVEKGPSGSQITLV